MGPLIDVAPSGDLVVGLGKNEQRKVVRVSTEILNFGSPVFKAMFGPEFKEGNTCYDASQPFELPEDDPVAMINLFRVMHWRNRNILANDKDWLQRLMIVADKYQCIECMQDSLFKWVTKSAENSMDLIFMYSMTGERETFENQSSALIRAPEAEVQN